MDQLNQLQSSDTVLIDHYLHNLGLWRLHINNCDLSIKHISWSIMAPSQQSALRHVNAVTCRLLGTFDAFSDSVPMSLSKFLIYVEGEAELLFQSG